MKRTAPIRVITFLLLAVCGALCQGPSSTDLLQKFQVGSNSPGSNSSKMQHQEARAWQSLPDAPLPEERPTSAERFRNYLDQTRSNQARSPLTFSAVGDPSLSQSLPSEKESGASIFLNKFLRPTSLKQGQSHSALSGSSFLGRSFSSASHTFILRDDAGRVRLNAPYFLSVLSLSAFHTASRPCWAQSTSATFNDFGSSIGGDAGINVFHEFEPGLKQLVKGHIPQVVSKIGARITAHSQR